MLTPEEKAAKVLCVMHGHELSNIGLFGANGQLITEQCRRCREVVYGELTHLHAQAPPPKPAKLAGTPKSL